MEGCGTILPSCITSKRTNLASYAKELKKDHRFSSGRSTINLMLARCIVESSLQIEFLVVPNIECAVASVLETTRTILNCLESWIAIHHDDLE